MQSVTKRPGRLSSPYQPFLASLWAEKRRGAKKATTTMQHAWPTWVYQRLAELLVVRLCIMCEVSKALQVLGAVFTRFIGTPGAAN